MAEQEPVKFSQVEAHAKAKDKIQVKIADYIKRYNAAPRPEKVKAREEMKLKKLYDKLTAKPPDNNYTFEELITDRVAYLNGWRDYEIGEKKSVTVFEEKTDRPSLGQGYVFTNWKDNRESDSYIMGVADSMLLLFVENYTGDDAIGQSQETRKNSSDKPTVKSYALLHAIWKMYDNTKAITDTNKASYALKYGISQNTLKREFVNYFQRKDRKPKSNDKRAVDPFIKCFSHAVDMIKTVCPVAYPDANEELSALKSHYQHNKD